MKKSPPALAPERLRALVFDLDGTLVDSYSAISRSLNHARAALGLPAVAESEVRGMVGRGLGSLIARSVGPEHVEMGVRLFREEYARVFARGTTALPGAKDTLRGLHLRGYGLAVASNKPGDFTERILDELGLLPFLDVVQGPERAGAPKPDPAMIHACLRELGVKLHEAAYVGDMVLDVESAARAGVMVILVPGGSSPTGELRRTGQRVLDRLSDLLSLLPERPNASS